MNLRFPMEVLRKVRSATCAIGIPRSTFADMVQDLTLPTLYVEGTGFLIRDDVILTNRHVITRLDQYVEKHQLRPDRKLVMFINQTDARTNHIYASWSKTTIVDNPEHDLALIGTGGFQGIEPLVFGINPEVAVGMEVGVYGYAYGKNLMERQDFGGKVYRFGPILQLGYISAIAPYDEGRWIERLLLDVRTRKGMSGGAIFDPHTGRPVGIHTSGMGDESVTAFGLPLAKAWIETLLAVHDSHSGIERAKVTLPVLSREGSSDA